MNEFVMYLVGAIAVLCTVTIPILVIRQVYDSKAEKSKDRSVFPPGYVCMAHRQFPDSKTVVGCQCVPLETPNPTDDEIDNPNWPHGRL